jgi:hypothetical protein
MKRALPAMLPPLDALSLSSHSASPTGVRNVNPPARRAFDLDATIRKTGDVQKVSNRANERRGGREANYDQDAGAGRRILKDDNACPMCPDEYGFLDIPGDLGPVELDEDGNPRLDEYGNPLRLSRRGWKNRQLAVDPDDHVKRCRRCGTEVAQYTNDAEPEKRNFADEEGVDRSQHSTVTVAEQVRLNYISPEELRMDRDDHAVWAVNNRLQQCFVWLEKMREGAITHMYRWWLTSAEVLRAKRLLRAVCVQWGLEGLASQTKKKNGNPILWSIFAALQMTAERENGFAVATVDLQQLLTIDGLRALLGHFEDDIQRTDERLYNATIARGQGAAGAWLLQKQKYRKPDYDAIPEESRITRVLYFNHLVKNTHMLLDNEGMHPLVRVNRPPKLLSPSSSFPFDN